MTLLHVPVPSLDNETVPHFVFLDDHFLCGRSLRRERKNAEPRRAKQADHLLHGLKAKPWS